MIFSLEKVSNKNKEIFILLYGLDDGLIKTLEEVGKKFQCSRQRINQIEQEILEKIRDTLGFKEMFEEYFESK